MNYTKIYKSLIERARTRVISGYFEKHHILPRCLGGTDNNENLVSLTAKEHYFAHLILTKIYPKEDKLVYALWAMAGTGRYKTSSRTYDSIKRQMSNATKRRLKVSNPWLGKKHKEESRKKQSESAKTRKITLENESRRREGISKGLSKVLLQYDKQMNLVKEWPSVILAAKELNTHVGSIVHAIQMKRVKSHKGFIWKYKNI